MSLARYKAVASSGAIDLPLADPRPAWPVASVTLYASHLKADGAVYEVVHTGRLSG
ncbi:MAG: hypothetical protein K2Q09_06100 [Phycisphaerales bacterium]|nr:hypothetical protein [Phycisphaerales bacterium]